MRADPNLTPMRDRAHGSWLKASLVAWVASYFLALYAAASTWPSWTRVTIAILPVPFFALFLVALITRVRQLDELGRRIHLEALALAFPMAALLLMGVGLLERVVHLSREDWGGRHLWIFLPLFYSIGLAVARRRYL